jgi:nicotinate-nucleotide adenylyltransferase
VSVGVFGGTFNPIHWGHLRAAEEVAEQLELERLLFVPSASPPHKANSGVAPARQRLAWVRDAIADNPRFAVDPLEIERGGRSYSVETLQEIGSRLAPEYPVFVIGCDAFSEMADWREPEALLALAHFAVMTRPPNHAGTLHDWLPRPLAGAFELSDDGRSGRHRTTGCWLRLVEVSALDVSSSGVRRCLREGRSVRYLLPETIRHDVEKNGGYAAT